MSEIPQILTKISNKVKSKDKAHRQVEEIAMGFFNAPKKNDVEYWEKQATDYLMHGATDTAGIHPVGRSLQGWSFLAKETAADYWTSLASQTNKPSVKKQYEVIALYFTTIAEAHVLEPWKPHQTILPESTYDYYARMADMADVPKLKARYQRLSEYFAKSEIMGNWR